MRFFLINALLLLAILVATAQKKQQTLFGHNDAMLYGRYWSDSEEGSKGKKNAELKPDIYQICKAYPALFSTDIGRIEHGHLEYWAGVVERLRKEIKEML